jgi:hypothetical protein
MQPTRTIRDAGDFARVERRRLQEDQRAVIHHWTRELHQVIDQCVASTTIRMEEATRQVKAGDGLCLMSPGQAGRPEFIRAPRLVLPHFWEGWPY